MPPNTSRPGPNSLQLQPGGRFTAINVSLRELIRVGFGLQASQIDGPDWIRTERFDVIGKAENEPAALATGPSPRILAMVRSLLAERFELDAWYVDHRSLRLDAKIVWMTLGTVLGRHGISAEGEATMPVWVTREGAKGSW